MPKKRKAKMILGIKNQVQKNFVQKLRFKEIQVQKNSGPKKCWAQKFWVHKFLEKNIWLLKQSKKFFGPTFKVWSELTQ